MPQRQVSEVKSQAPSVSFLPGTRRFHWHYNTATMGASNYVLQRMHYTSSATRLQAFNRKNFTPILRIPIIGFFPPSILLENSIPASRSGVVKSTGGMMELRLSDDVTMGESNRNTADIGFILRLCSNAPTFLRFRRRERF